MTATEIQKRIEAQASDSERELIADSVIINNESEDKLLIQVEHIWRTLVEMNSNRK
jgi:dephospho-CoA kinase